MYTPDKAQQMYTPMRLQTPETVSVAGVNKKTYTNAERVTMANFTTYGGTEHDSNGVLVVEDTGTVTTWFDPAIKSDCRIKRLTDGAVFEIVGEPENIEMRNMYLVFKVRRLKGGA